MVKYLQIKCVFNVLKGTTHLKITALSVNFVPSMQLASVEIRFYFLRAIGEARILLKQYINALKKVLASNFSRVN